MYSCSQYNTDACSLRALAVIAEQFATEVLEVVRLKRAAGVSAEMGCELAGECVPMGLV